MSEDLLPGVSVIDLRVVDFDASIGDRLQGNLKLGLLLKWTQVKLGSAWLVEMTKHKDKVLK